MPEFSHAQLDSQSIEYFNVIRAQRWLGMKKGVWRSGGPPQFFDLPCFHQHLYLYLNTLFCLSLQPILKENTHRIYQRLESDHEVRRRMNEIVWHWNDNSLRFFFFLFFEKESWEFLYWCAPSVLLWPGYQPWAYFSINSALLALSRRKGH